jgi:hypothetical protein
LASANLSLEKQMAKVSLSATQIPFAVAASQNYKFMFTHADTKKIVMQDIPVETIHETELNFYWRLM